MAEGRSSVLLADEPGGDFPTWRDMPLKEDHNFGGRILVSCSRITDLVKVTHEAMFNVPRAFSWMFPMST